MKFEALRNHASPIVTSVSIVLTIGAGLLAAYLRITGDIGALNTDTSVTKVKLEQVVTEQKQMRSDQHDVAAEWRSALANLSQQITDLRVQIARRDTASR